MDECVFDKELLQLVSILNLFLAGVQLSACDAT